MSRYCILCHQSLLSTGPLHAKEDQVRCDTVEVCRQLARQCSDASAVEEFVKFLFDIFFGSDGKLTITSQKISVLQVSLIPGSFRA